MTEKDDENDYDRALSAWLFSQRDTVGRTAVVQSFAALIRRHFPDTAVHVRHMADTFINGAGAPPGAGADIARTLDFRGATTGEVRFKVPGGVSEIDPRFDRAAAALAAALAWPTGAEIAATDGSADLAVLAHELRAPLQICLTSADLLRREASDRIRPLAERITEAVGHARAILDAGRPRPTNGRSAIGEIRTPLSEVVKDIDRWRTDDRSARARVLVRVQEDSIVALAPFRVRQVLINLLKNAEEAITMSGVGGRIEVILDRAAIPGIGTRAVLSVIDDGPGVPAAIRERIFESGFTTKSNTKGRGIGLAVVKRIVDDSGGGVRVEPVEPHGTRFRIEWPLADGESARDAEVTAVPIAAEKAAGGETARSESTGDSSTVRPATTKILAIDDDPGMLRTYRMILDLEGKETVGVATAADGLQKLAAEKFDAILVDVRLKDMRGDEFFAALKKRHPSLVPRVIFATGDIQNEETRRFLNATGNPYLIKPFEIADLLRAIKIAVRAADR